MTERGLPIVGGAPACPFVALEDDRDERATSPDHRHRCYAEAQPAPRALAHQEAYCLSSAFPVCPTFQDWARREAARARPPDLPPAEDTEGDEEDEGLPALVDDRPPRRGSRGTWSAPPPWLSGTGSGPATPSSAPGAGGADQDHERAADAASSGAAAAGAAAAGLSGSFADRLVSDHPTASRPALGGGQDQDEDDWDGDSPPQGTGPPDERPRYAADRGRYLDEASDEDEAMAIASRSRRRERLEAGSDRMESTRDRDIGAPAWERPRRLEAYPTLRSQRWTSTVLPTVALGLIALLLAVAALIFLPQLLGIGSPGPGASATPSVGASVAPSGESFAPSLAPGATPFVYTVQKGDNMFKIAQKFGVPIDALVAANKDTHPNPDVLKVGDTLVIPVVVPSEVPGESASAAP